jgi:hypothetical protein
MKTLLFLITISTAHAFSSKLPTPSQADAGTLVMVPNLKEEKQQNWTMLRRLTPPTPQKRKWVK